MQRRDFEKKQWSYLRGEFRFGGWWYYYLSGLLVKLPLGLWGLAVLALLFAGPGRLRSDMLRSLPLLVFAAAVLVLVSSQTGLNRHFRYALPAAPFGLIWISRVFPSAGRRQHPLAGVCACVLMVWSLFSSLSVSPHNLSYFNELAGGPGRGHAWLLDSAIDWGQDLSYLMRWIEQHPDATPLYIAYCGAIDPESVGVGISVPRTGSELPRSERGPKLSPGWYAVSVELIYGYPQITIPVGGGEWQLLARDAYRHFLALEPDQRLGYSIYLYHIRPESDELRTMTVRRAGAGQAGSWYGRGNPGQF